ncbi:hypothetical protein G9A89_005638 [Geosiphon pyriformis]|nr:hypothetical protein G9A89_005638 [Geosiphon pyriformis]
MSLELLQIGALVKECLLKILTRPRSKQNLKLALFLDPFLLKSPPMTVNELELAALEIKELIKEAWLKCVLTEAPVYRPKIEE